MFIKVVLIVTLAGIPVYQQAETSFHKKVSSLFITHRNYFVCSVAMYEFWTGYKKRLLVSTVLISCSAKILSKPVDSFVCSPKELV